MVPKKYLQGLDANDYDTPGIFGVRHARSPGSWRIICSYDDGTRHKAALFNKMKAAGQVERPGTWEFHHVVEGQHFADIDFAGQLERMYVRELPCVLIAKEEHTAYNRLLHIRETDELYRDQGLPRDVLLRSAAAAAAGRNRAEHARLRNQAERLRQLYRNAYSGDSVLIAIAENVITDAVLRLR